MPPPSLPAEMQAPPAHICPGTHALQARPPRPQADCWLPGLHVPAESQQPSQLEGRHWAVVGPHAGTAAATAPSTKPAASHRMTLMRHYHHCSCPWAWRAANFPLRAPLHSRSGGKLPTSGRPLPTLCGMQDPTCSSRTPRTRVGRSGRSMCSDWSRHSSARDHSRCHSDTGTGTVQLCWRCKSHSCSNRCSRG